MKHWTIIIMIIIFLAFGVSITKAQDASDTNNGSGYSQEVVLNFIKDFLKEKAKYSGNVDLFDEKINKVRNLKLIEMGDKLEQANGQYVSQARFRDVSSGDTVDIKMIVEIESGKLKMGNLVIGNVEKSAVSSTDPSKEYTDEEIKDVMLKYFQQKSKFTGTFDMFDEKTQKMRNLTIGNLQSGIRRFGTRFIGRVDAVDQVSNENLELDISADKKEGLLGINNVKIFSVDKVQR